MKGLYVIVDPDHCGQRSALDVLDQVLAGGCAHVQLRAKSLCDAEYLALARAMKKRCAAARVPFWINDRADIALLSEADGLHLGQNDVPIHDARALLPKQSLGLSTHNLAQVLRAPRELLSAVGFGPVFDTQSKLSPSPTVGLELLRRACVAAGGTEVIAIGGIMLEHASAIRAAGATYAAVIRAVCAAEDPRSAAYALHRALLES